MVSSARLKWLHELAEHTRAAEQALKFNDRPLTARIQKLRELTTAELAEHRKLEREMQKDYDDYNAGDWTR